MIKERAHENATRNTVAGVHRRTGGVSALRRGREADSFRPTLHARSARTRIQKEVAGESEPQRPQAKGQALGLGPRFPRHGLVDRFCCFYLASEFRVGHALANDLPNGDIKSFRIGHLASIEAARLLVDVSEQVKRFHAHIGSVQAALQKAPEVFHPIGVNFTVRVFDSVIDDRVLVVRFQPIIGKQFIGEDCRASLYVFPDVLLKVLLSAVLYDHRPHVSAALQHPHNQSLILAAGSSDDALALRLVHVPSFAADKGFIYFDAALAAHLSALLALLSKPDSVHQEPRGFLSHAQCPRHFATADPVLRVLEHPNSWKPLVETDGRVFHDGSDLHGKLSSRMAGAALPAQLIFEEANAGTPATRADYALLPLGAPGHKVVKTVLLIGKVHDGFLKGLGFVSGFHTTILTQNGVLRKYIMPNLAPRGAEPNKRLVELTKWSDEAARSDAKNSSQ